MPVFPQYQSALLVQAGNYRLFTQGTTVAAGVVTIAAACGDIITNKVVAGDASTYNVTLPSVALGGPVVVKVTGLIQGNASNTMVVVPQVVDTVAGCKIDGFGSISLVYPGDLYVLASDGTQWWTVSKAHTTTQTW